MNKNIKLLVLDVDGTMTDGGMYITESGEHFKKFNAKDGMGIKIAMDSGIEVGIISHSGVTRMVTERANMLGMKYIYVGREPKLDILNGWMEELSITYEQVAFIGDDVNDLEIIQNVGLTACPVDAVAKIIESVDVVLSKKGGDGAVREFIDLCLLSNA